MNDMKFDKEQDKFLTTESTIKVVNGERIPITQEDVNDIVFHFRLGGLNEDEIRRIGEYKNWFYLNPKYASQEEDTKGEDNFTL